MHAMKKMLTLCVPTFNSMETLNCKFLMKLSSKMEFRATTLCDKMKELIYGPSHGNDMESQLHLWDYRIEFDALEYYLLPTSQNPNMYSYMQNVYEIHTF
ncbi:hypothetical protein H5410_049809 [Solanum commersonii]|uniref:Uncharacterized protein n=1 Tax=Solanum commersonii TaxID=4109 RepID=A0A9J5WW53_SOLCO|nr:hypothetical protein H5410_049809 [Solanum commersonii]